MSLDTEAEQQPVPVAFALADRYAPGAGAVHLTGVQALVRVIIEQRHRDRAAGLRTGAFVSGYPGSPLAGLDKELHRNAATAGPLGIVHQPGVNEELAATAVFGSQLAASRPDALVDGVTGWWYGKAPGLDRAADALRHANFAGTGPRSGVVVLVGDDPAAKSSTLPSASELALHDAAMPVLAPGSVAEVIELGLHAVALSRASGLWVGMKLVSEVVDGSATVHLSEAGEPAVPVLEELGAPYRHEVSGNLLPPVTHRLEENLHTVRLEIARRYGRANDLNPVTVSGPRDRIGVVAAGKTYHDLRQGLAERGVGDAELRAAGVRLLHVRMMWPIDPATAREFAAGLREVVVLEEKRPFLESWLKDSLYGLPSAPRVVGKTDERGSVLVPQFGVLSSKQLADVVAGRVPGLLAEPPSRKPVLLPLLPSRKPFYCSGCPHNLSTQVPDGTLVGAGIGCHALVGWMPPDRYGEVTGMTQMGGEGAQWVGMQPFLPAAAFVQNLGDGTFFHSGHLAVRQAVAAGARMTYKILYNDAVAMTGGQRPPGVIPVGELTRLLELEGVTRTIVTTDDRKRYRGVRLARNAVVWRRDRIDEAQRVLTGLPGVTVLIHDQQCTAEKRRKRKRGVVAPAGADVVINERVCEGCGDCARKSNCLSLHPVETEFGRKTRIHQPSCNQDASCVEGDCPSFVSVRKETVRRGAEPPARMPTPGVVELADGRVYSVRMAGVGGTGVVTVSQVLVTAALLDGLHAAGLDQTGLSQKGGPVVSDVRIGRAEVTGNKVSTCDLLLGFDPLVALAPNSVATVDSGRTRAVVNNSVTPTGDMVVGVEAARVAPGELRERLASVTSPGDLWVDATRIAEDLFGDHALANVVVLGAAHQAGLLPVSGTAVREAIRVNGVAVEANLAAFEWGRATVARPDRVRAALAKVTAPESTTAASEVLGDWEAPAGLRALVLTRVADLIGYQDARYAQEYLELVRAVHATETRVEPEAAALTEAVARNLHKLMAYKDEYEVARLHLRHRDELGGGAMTWHLHPPVLRSLGMRRKIKLRSWLAVPAFRVLAASRRVRGSWLDPFGHTGVRRVERDLVGEYRAAVQQLLPALTAGNHGACVDLAGLPDLVRGYEDVKLASVTGYRERLSAALRAITTP
ncbi:indolepyruvate ferredoxin oxidoreductase family protein [Lentzea sp.]|uniref:indolepyruvate ferredoxin oxidoreductase family protein n=1 Tax=Lentzea sp. TaxID=56099 RepID=UPI002B5867D2|nr:indolepyruvate ferredoxin oxidoreductase family protein [Lentzea sp.]HUQ60121.1 indolepyruvate ferredoxin oxidoreductase family protein [Lentzea sp.]